MKSYELNYTTKDTGINLPLSFHRPYLIQDWNINGKSMTFIIGVWASEAAFLAGKDIIRSYSIPIHNNYQIYNSQTKENDSKTLYDDYNFGDLDSNPIDKLDLLLKTEDLSALGWDIPDYKNATTK